MSVTEIETAFSEMPLTIADEGPGRFNHCEAFCHITYRCENPKFAIREIRVWNSRDGRIPDWYTHVGDSEKYMRVKGSEVCQPAHTPALGDFVIADADNKGTPRIQVATMGWLDGFKKLYANPSKTIRRLEEQLEAGKRELTRQAAKHEAAQTESAKEIQKLRNGVNDLFLEREAAQKEMQLVDSRLTEKDNQIARLTAEVVRLRHFETAIWTIRAAAVQVESNHSLGVQKQGDNSGKDIGDVSQPDKGDGGVRGSRY